MYKNYTMGQIILPLNLVAELLRQCFVQFLSKLVQDKEIDAEAIFIDGTKIEANANNFTFVWRKSVERYSSNLIEKSNVR